MWGEIDVHGGQYTRWAETPSASVRGPPFFERGARAREAPTVQRDTAPDSPTCVLPMWMRRSATVAQPGRSWRVPSHPMSIVGVYGSILPGDWKMGFLDSRVHDGPHLPSPLAADLSPSANPTEPHWPTPAPAVPCSTRLALAAARWPHRIGTTAAGAEFPNTPNCLTSLLSNLPACDRLPRHSVRSSSGPHPPGRPLVHSQSPGGCPPARPPKVAELLRPQPARRLGLLRRLWLAAAWCVAWSVLLRRRTVPATRAHQLWARHCLHRYAFPRTEAQRAWRDITCKRQVRLVG